MIGRGNEHRMSHPQQWVLLQYCNCQKNCGNLPNLLWQFVTVERVHLSFGVGFLVAFPAHRGAVVYYTRHVAELRNQLDKKDTVNRD